VRTIGRRAAARLAAGALGVLAVVGGGCAAQRPFEAKPHTLSVWAAGSPKRGIGLPPKTPLSAQDYEALGILRPGAVVVFSAQLGDPDPLRWIGPDPGLQRWLAAHQDMTQIVRMWPVRGPDDPATLARRIVSIHQRFPWIRWFQITNEPDIEWPRDQANWPTISAWSEAVWWQVDRYRRTTKSASDIKLLFPPLAQGSVLDPEKVGYDQLRSTIELYLDHGDGLAGHEYWDRDQVFLVEQRWPAWLQARLPSVPFFVLECGRRPGPANGPPDATLGDELAAFAARSQAQVIAPFVLSSPGGSFDQFDFVDREGHVRSHLISWASHGP
jgi:hypothetical protein